MTHNCGKIFLSLSNVTFCGFKVVAGTQTDRATTALDTFAEDGLGTVAMVA